MRCGYRAGVPLQQPYTKYEPDNDEVRVAYKRVSEDGGSGGRAATSWLPCPGGPSDRCRGVTLRTLIVTVLFMLGLIVGYLIRRAVTSSSAPDCTSGHPLTSSTSYEFYSVELSRELRKRISAESLRQNLRNYTQAVHISGTSGNNRLHEYLHEQLGLLHHVVTEAQYNVLLSYHDWEKSNVVYLLNENGSVIYASEYRGPSVNGDPRSADHPEFTESYAAYSPNGSAEGELVYANYGEEKDFKLLLTKGVSCHDKIVIMRYGRIFPGRMVKHAEDCGAKAVLLYPDPSEVVSPGTASDTYPSGRYLPGWATRRDSLWRFGDPVTPSLPSRDGMFRLQLSEASLGKIPVQPISYDDAYRFMSHMSGPSDNDFYGSMRGNITYHMGPGYSPLQLHWKVRVEVFNELETRQITNVFGVIRGHVEPDRYVIVGCHYDSWTFGAVNPNSGTAILMELSKAFSALQAKGWRPRRTIILAHWDAGDLGQLGSYEWVEDNVVTLADRTVAYMNLDEAVSGSYVIDVEASPMLRNIVMNASQQTPSSDAVFDHNSAETVYDTWLLHSPSDFDNFMPRFNYPSPNSDHAPFVYRLGVPVLWLRYANHMNSASHRHYPAYHTVVDNFDYMERFVDPSLSAHVSLTQLAADIVLQTSSSARLPLDVRELADTLEMEYDALQQDGMDLFNDLLECLQRAIRRVSEASALFYDSFLRIDVNNDLMMRRYNDRLMMLSKVFVHSSLPFKRPQIRNFLFAPSGTNSYEFSTFTGIRDAFAEYLKVRSVTSNREYEARIAVERQISLVTLAIQSAYSILSEDEYFQ